MLTRYVGRMIGRPNPKGYDWVFSHDYSAGLLCYIYDMGTVCVVDLLTVCTSHRTMSKVIQELIDCGLVQMTVEKKGHTAKKFHVTSKGRSAARLLNKLRTTVDGFPHGSGVNTRIENF